MSYTRQASFDSQRALFELAISSLERNESKVLEENLSWDYRPINWSPDSSTVVCETHGPHDENELHLLAAKGGESRRLTLALDFATSDSLYPGGAPWLWDGKGQALYSITTHAVWKVTMVSGDATKLAEIPGHTLSGLIAPRGNLHLWSSTGDRSAVVLARDIQTLEEGFYRIDLVSGDFMKLLEEPQKLFPGAGLMEAAENQGPLPHLAGGRRHPGDRRQCGPSWH